MWRHQSGRARNRNGPKPAVYSYFRLLASEKQTLESRPLKIYKNEKNIGKIYSPVGKFAEWTK